MNTGDFKSRNRDFRGDSKQSHPAEAASAGLGDAQIAMDVRLAIFYRENPAPVDPDFLPQNREAAREDVGRLMDRRWEMDPLAAQVYQRRQLHSVSSRCCS
jgi:hypothetical protein